MADKKVKIDKVAPKLTASMPSDGKKPVDLNSDLMFKFNEDIKVGKGNIVITDGEDTRVIPIADKQISITGKTLTINLIKDLLPSSQYVVKISPSAITDLAGNVYSETKAPLSFFTKNGVRPIMPEQLNPSSTDEKPVVLGDAAPVIDSSQTRQPIFTFSVDKLIVNEGQTTTFKITTDVPAPVNGLNFPFAITGTADNGKDFSVGNKNTINLPAGQKEGTLTLNIASDKQTEGLEYLIVSPEKLNPILVLLNDTSLTSSNPSEKITISQTGGFDTSSNDTQFDFIAGNYNYQITDFGEGDVLNLPNDVEATVKNSNFSDGSVDVQWAAKGQVILITLTGLTTAQDGAIYSVTSFNNVFGDGSIQ